jgi:hypothetical protein
MKNKGQAHPAFPPAQKLEKTVTNAFVYLCRS